MADNALIKPEDQLKEMAVLLKSREGQLKKLLPEHMSVERLQMIALVNIQRNPSLIRCTQGSLIGAIVQCAQLGLEPDSVSGEAALVPYKNKVQLIPMYKGLLKLARRSGEIGPITAEVVYEGDKYKMTKGSDPIIQHDPSSEKQKPEAMIAVYAVAHYIRHDKPQFAWLWKWEVDAIRERSPAKNDGPWVTDYIAMAKKTALRQLCKLLPSSPHLQTAVHLDELHEIGKSQGLETIITIEAEDENGKGSLDSLVDDDQETAEEKAAREKKVEEEKAALAAAKAKDEKKPRGRPKKQEKVEGPEAKDLNFGG